MATSDVSDRRIQVTRAGRPMATDVSVLIAADPDQEQEASEAANACMAWFDEVDARLSRFRPESELSQLNAASGAWFAASPVLYDAIEVALRAARASGGLFDPTLLPQLEALGYDRDFAQIARRNIAADANAPVRPAWAPPTQAWRAIEMDPDRQRIRLPAGARIDLGGIAKGWAVDIALATYCERFPGALVNAGGDLRAIGGPQPGEAWSVGIRSPRAEAGAPDMDSSEWAATIHLSRGALATSGAARRWWRENGVVRHHLLDPRTGLPLEIWTGANTEDPEPVGASHAIAMVTALAPTAERAEVAAKLALLRGFPEATRAVETAWERYGAIGPDDDLDAGVALIITFGDGSFALSNNARAWLATWGAEGARVPMLISSEGVEALPPLPGRER
ncbi:MAG TPA: FAD:protein FMN transferase [Ktedonobacterales bacterium]